MSSSDESFLAQLLKHYVPQWSKEQQGEAVVFLDGEDEMCDGSDWEEESNSGEQLEGVKLRPGRKAGVTETLKTTQKTYTYYKRQIQFD